MTGGMHMAMMPMRRIVQDYGCALVMFAWLLAGAPAHAQGPSQQGTTQAPPKSSKASSAQANASAGVSTTAPNALQGFSQNRGQPIHIDAAKLEVRDKDKVATFTGDAKTGDVKVVQGDTIMRSKQLVVFYDQDTPAAGTKTMPAATPGPGGSQRIRRLEAKGNVIVTQKDQTVTGDKGVFDMKTNTVTMTGGVLLTQGENVMQGESLVVDLTTGVSRIDPGKTGRINALIKPSKDAVSPGPAQR